MMAKQQCLGPEELAQVSPGVPGVPGCSDRNRGPRIWGSMDPGILGFRAGSREDSEIQGFQYACSRRNSC